MTKFSITMKVLDIKNNLPNGAIGIIAKSTKTSYVTVLNFFNGKNNPKNKNQLLESALDLLKAEKEKEKQLMLEFETLLCNEKSCVA